MADDRKVVFNSHQLWETNDPKSIEPGGNDIAILPFAGCEPQD